MNSKKMTAEETDGLKYRVLAAKQKIRESEASYIKDRYVPLITKHYPKFNTAELADRIRNVWHQKVVDEEITLAIESLIELELNESKINQELTNQ